jgi:hypothetical protein
MMVDRRAESAVDHANPGAGVVRWAAGRRSMPTVDQVLAQRLRTQRLASAPLGTPAEVVGLLGCVQAQERDHAFFSLGLRSRDATYPAVRAAYDRGEFLRTHILRPTWHFVLAADLRWILALTSPRIESSMAARHRELALDDPRTVSRAIDVLTDLLAGRRYLTRAEIGAEFAARGGGLPQPGPALGHLLLVAELRGVVCSGPMKSVQHSYALVDEIVPPSTALERDDALRRLVHRFFAGHGPASVADFVRWSSLTGGDTRRALADLADQLDRCTVDGVEQWFAPDAAAPPSRRAPATWLLPVYDEVVLSYPRVRFPAAPGHPHVQRPDPFWAPIIHRRRDVGSWKRTVHRDRVTVQTVLAAALDPVARSAVAKAAARLAGFLERPLDYQDGTASPASAAPCPADHGASSAARSRGTLSRGTPPRPRL